MIELDDEIKINSMTDEQRIRKELHELHDYDIIEEAVKKNQIKKCSNQFKASSRDKLKLIETKETNAVPMVGRYYPKLNLI